MVEMAQRRDGSGSREQLDPSSIRVLLVNMEGEGGLSLHEPIGVEAIAGRVRRDLGITPAMYDTQPELFRTGKIDTTRLAGRVRDFVNASGSPDTPTVVGFSVPIYSYDYLKATLIKLKQDPPQRPVRIVIGNAIATFTPPERIHRDFPDVIIVKGEGDESFPQIVNRIAKGEEVESVVGPSLPDLRDYAEPYRAFTGEILYLGGSMKIEASRGCDFGACTFCSRDWRGGKDYRTVPEEVIIPQVRELIDTLAVTHFELTDEEAFGGDLEATARLVSAWKSSDLPRTSFAASLRVDTILLLQEQGLLEQLRDIGLDKVFLGVEGGSDSYLKQIAKGQKIEQVHQAIDIVRNSTVTVGEGEKKPLDMEMGFITFSWRMSKGMLRDNVAFLSNERVTPHVSSLFNLLEVRAGTLDEMLLHRNTQKGILEGYDPEANFSVNSSSYRNVPFLDPEVGRIYKEAKAFARADESLYYAVKSINRAATLPAHEHKQARDFYLRMKTLYLRYLRDAVGLEESPNITEERRALVEQMRDSFGVTPQGDALDSVRREIHVFLLEENERQEEEGEQVGAMAVCLDDQERILLVRPRHQEQWALPGGGVKSGERAEDAMVREVMEEVGARVQIMGELPDFVKKDHIDKTTGHRPKLTLHHFLTRLQSGSVIDILNADHEIADVLWLSADDVLCGRVQTRENVVEVVRALWQNRTVKTTEEQKAPNISQKDQLGRSYVLPGERQRIVYTGTISHG